jgi:hypothetical protein
VAILSSSSLLLQTHRCARMSSSTRDSEKAATLKLFVYFGGLSHDTGPVIGLSDHQWSEGTC